jgi:hypothetical protein
MHKLHCFRPTVRCIPSFRPSYCIGFRTELATESQNLVTAGPTAPARETVFPPTKEEVDPCLVMWERYFDLHLLPTCHASMKRQQ